MSFQYILFYFYVQKFWIYGKFLFGDYNIFLCNFQHQLYGIENGIFSVKC